MTPSGHAVVLPRCNCARVDAGTLLANSEWEDAHFLVSGAIVSLGVADDKEIMVADVYAEP